MNIVLNGVETNNKGAELMLYAILQEIERKYPNAKVYLPFGAYQKNLSDLHTSLNLKNIPFLFIRRIACKLHIPEILRCFNIDSSFITFRNFLKPDYFIDASGFAVSDQWKLSAIDVKRWKYICNRYGKGRTRMVMLPQAFGPAEMPQTKMIMKMLSNSADVIMPREQVSKEWLLRAHVNPDKIYLFPDFTALVEGIPPKGYEHLYGGICIIPNCRMIDKGIISSDNYLNILNQIALLVKSSGRPVYFLNHEGPDDEKLAKLCVDRLNGVQVVSKLNALEIKGLISTAYLCISSRFHGVISALNSAVPCLSTSWSHKYSELYKDYGLNDRVLHLDDIEEVCMKVKSLMDIYNNEAERNLLKLVKPSVISRTKQMWEIVWK